MGLLSPILRSVGGGGLAFHCPGCKRRHLVYTGPGSGPRWMWDGELTRPTFTPSVRVSYEGRDAGEDGAPPALCHFFVSEGRMQFLTDSTHELAGKTVDMVPFPDADG